LRLAVFGWVQEGGGSVASAHFQLCGALLKSGHHLDFYADPSFVPDPGYRTPRFEYVPVEVSLRRELDPDRFPGSMKVAVSRLGGARRTRRYRELGVLIARSRHSALPYDAVLFLGTPPGSTIDGIPTIVWPQSSPQNELLAIRNMSSSIKRISGRSAYLKLRLYYEVKDRLAWRWARRHYLVLASRAARDEAVAFGVPVDRVCVTPYAVDLARFVPGETPSAPLRRVLCIGRLDPRKRVDLLVDAVAVLATRRDDFRVDVIGRDGYIPGWSAFVEQAGRHLPITYRDAVPQSEILEHLQSADVVVQPSEREEFGHAVAEALACGIPVVTGPTNGTREYAPRDASVTFDRYNPQSLAEAIEGALAISRAPSVRAACRAAAGAFAPERVAATVVDFIRASGV
jgi:glycosyltransferase involved in cell wall biosynthesis